MAHRLGLMRAANITLEETDDAIRILTSPDEDSSNPENEGRRIEKVVGGWRVLNWDYYRTMAMSQAAREEARIRQQNFRANKKKIEANRELREDDTEQNASWSGREMK